MADKKCPNCGIELSEQIRRQGRMFGPAQISLEGARAFRMFLYFCDGCKKPFINETQEFILSDKECLKRMRRLEKIFS